MKTLWISIAVVTVALLCAVKAQSGNSTIVVPANWTCLSSNYNTSDGCHCDCGAVDPDCFFAANRTLNVTYRCPCANMVCVNAKCRGDCNPDKTSLILTQLNTFTILTIINTMLIGTAFLIAASLIAIRCSTDPYTSHTRPGGESVKDVLIRIYNWFVTCNGRCNPRAALTTDAEKERLQKMSEEDDM